MALNLSDDGSPHTAGGLEQTALDAETPWPSPTRAWFALGILLLAYTVSFADRMIMSLLIGPIRAEFNISDTQASLLVGFAFASFYALMGLPFGALVDRVNRKALIMIGICVWCVATALCGLASSFILLFLARMLVGTGEATLSPSAYSMLSDYFPRQKLGRVLSIYTLGVPIGSGVALMAGGLVVQAVMHTPVIDLPLIGPIASWRGVFLMVGIPGLLVGVLMAAVREPERRGSGATADHARMSEFFAFIASRKGAVGWHMLAISLLALVFYGAVTWTPTFMVRTHGVAIGHAGLMLGLILASGGLCGLLAGGWWADRQIAAGRMDGHARVGFYAAIGFTPLLIAAYLAPNLPLCLTFLALGIGVAYTPFGVAGAALQLIAPNRLRGKMTALYLLTTSLASLGAGPTAVAMINDLILGNEQMLRYAIVIVIATVMPLSIIASGLSLKYFRAAATA